MGKIHVGDCPHHPDERVRGGDPFINIFRHSCAACGLIGPVAGSAKDAERGFAHVVNRERHKRRSEFYEDTHLDSLENLMKKPPGGYMNRARRLS